VSLAIAFKGPEGIVLAADSRVTLAGQMPDGEVFTSHFDNATKLLSVQGQKYVGIVTYGAGGIGLTEPRTAHGFIPEFEAELAAKHQARAKVEDVAQALGEFFAEQWKHGGMAPAGTPGQQPMVFLVAGYDDGEAYGRVYEVIVPDAPAPIEKNPNPGEFGLTFGGQHELVSRIMAGVDPQAVELAKDALELTDEQGDTLLQRWAPELAIRIPYQFLPLQDCVDLATFLVYMTSTVQSWTVGIRGVGGAVDVATITRTEGFRAIQQKKIEAWG
jgi:hypothetical protein